MIGAEFLDPFLPAGGRIHKNLGAAQETGNNRYIHGRIVYHEYSCGWGSKARVSLDAPPLYAFHSFGNIADAFPIHNLLPEREGEGGSLAEHAPHLKAASHKSQELLRNVQSQACALYFPGLFPVETIKGDENLVQFLFPNAASRICDRHVEGNLALSRLMETD